jgi:ABC-type glycerol-3-phosphate transport system substrate-binding protein
MGTTTLKPRRWRRRARWRDAAVAGMRALIVSVVALQVGCAPFTTAEPTSALPSPPPEPPTPSPTTTPAGPVVFTLTLWVPEELSPYGEDAAAAALAQRLSDFGQSYADLQVEVIVKRAHGRGGLVDYLRTASEVAPSILPDLVVLDTDDLRLAAQAGLLQPLDGLLPEGMAADRFPFASQLGEVDGQTVAIVIAAELEHLAYRPALLATVPITWGTVLSAPAPFLFPAAGEDGGVNAATLVQYLAVGGHLTGDEGSPRLEQAPLVEVLTFYEQGVSAGVISPTLVLPLADVEGCWEAFERGQAGLAVVGSRRYWTASDSRVAFSSLPTRDGTALALVRGGWAVALVTSDPNRQQLAMTLFNWLLAPEHTGPWTQSAGYLPGTASALQRWSVTAAERAALEALLEGTVTLPHPDVRAAVGPPLQAAVEAVLNGRRRPAEAAAEAVRAVGQ